MRLDRLTQRSQEAIQAAKEIARERSHTQLDEIMIFHPLRRDHIREIVQIQLEGLRHRLIVHAKLDLETTPEAESLLAEQGYDPQYDARPLKRVIQKLFETPLAIEILEHKFQAGDVVQVDREDEHLVLTKKVGAVAAA
ncbi:MAG: hypothetical protein VX603_10810 [Gemmatimonadota bacterium]|nr:hypothetical protein [Gemmatimonadota bacterium]